MQTRSEQNARRAARRQELVAADPDYWKKRRARAKLRGPSGKHTNFPVPNIHAEHELRGQSTLVSPEGLVQRWDKTGLAPTDEPAYAPIPDGAHVVSTSTMVDGTGATRVQWIRAEQDKIDRDRIFWESAKAAAEKAAIPLGPIAVPRWSNRDLIVFYPLGDPHIGLLSWAPETGEHHDAKIAERDLINVTDMLVDAAPSASTAVLINLGDYLHAQTDEQRTPRGGHKLDVDGRRGKILELGLTLMLRMVIRLLEKHDRVIVANIRGNHDPDVAVMIALWLRAMFKDNPRVEIDDGNSPYFYYEFGACFVQASHGHGANPDRTTRLATIHPAWGRTKFRYSYGGHVHSKNRIEFAGIRWESFNTLAAPDYYTIDAAYSSQRELSAITMHKDWGEIARATVDLSQARARQNQPEPTYPAIGNEPRKKKS